uniref:NTR domain-containing protein n=1 Tax=Sparus aurata TaxID=8175 RepID=A0A671Y7T8_SPAAU
LGVDICGVLCTMTTPILHLSLLYRQVMSAPNLLRVGTTENIFVECQDYTGGNILVEIIVMNHPTKAKRLASTTVTLASENSFQQLAQIMVNEMLIKQYVYLQARFPDRLLEKVVMVSFQSGYIFIQTDKTLYTPKSTGEFNVSILVSKYITIENIYHTIYLSFQIKQSNTSYSAEFEVKEYVLPRFKVNLTPVRPFFYVDSPDFTVNIRAMYLPGEEVDGMAFVVFGVMQEGLKRSFPGSLQRVQIARGVGLVSLRREHITQTFPNILDLVGSSIYVAVSVLTESGGEMVEEELRGIQIVTSPYTIHFKKTPKYFKPGMVFDVAVEVVNPDETPAQGVAVVVDPGQVTGVTEANGMARITINTVETSGQLQITAKTSDPHITLERQASATMTALPHATKSNKYMHIGVNTAEVTLGENLKVIFMLTNHEQMDITYLILSRGQLVKKGRYHARGQVMISLVIPITKEMLPSFRIIAFYHTDDNEVVSDSVWVDVKDSCMGSLKLESSRPAPSYEPRKMFRLKVTGDPAATVGLVAVDKGAYDLNNKHGLTQKKVWDIVEKSDTGCTPGGGKDSMSVFYDAGLLFESTASGTPYRQGDTTLYTLDVLLVKRYTCSISQVIKQHSSEMHLHLVYCAFRSSHMQETSEEDDDNSYMDSSEIVSRTSFPESWLWSDIKLPACPRQTPNCDTTSYVKTVPLKDSITTWQFIGISLSRTHSICVAEPLEVIVRKEFFIDLKLPYPAVRGEQLEIKAILHNYSPDPITVRVDLIEEVDVCSSASKRGKYRQEVKVGPQTTRSVPFIIIPMKEGQYRVEVKAAVKDSSLYDGIMKTLRVVVRETLSEMLSFCDVQKEIINSEIPLTDLNPNAPASTIIFVTGREPVSALVENAISGTSMGSLIRRPSGSGESNMILMTLPVIATMYLDKTNQWETVGFEKRNEALQHIKVGYQNLLAFRKNDGSFAVFLNRQSSTWLTAYVTKVFAMANNLVPMQRNVICDAVKFLILNTQQPDGTFREVGKIYHGEMIGDVRGTNSEASMTAFCLIALQESRTLCAATVNSLHGSIDKAVAYLELHLSTLTNPYAVAMTSYALANENKLNREILYNFAFEDARPVVRWFNQQQRVGGGYGSTQATIMVYQAVAEYWATAEEQEYNLDVDILLPETSKADKYNFNRKNFHATRTSKMVSLYYALPTQIESYCQKFNLSVQLLPGNLVSSGSSCLFVCSLFSFKQRDATLSVLDIGLLTGFTIDTNDLDLLSKGRARIIARYEMNTVLSERGSLIIYMDKVSHTQPAEITFRIHQRFNVGVLQPAAVSVYEYYEQTPCVKFYHPERRNGQILRLCRNDECICAEDWLLFAVTLAYRVLLCCLSIKARNLCLSVGLCVCASNISADQDQTDLRFSAWLLRGLRVCNVGFLWTTMIPLIKYFINDLRILLALSTIATCAPEHVTAEPTLTPNFLIQRMRRCTQNRIYNR